MNKCNLQQLVLEPIALVTFVCRVYEEKPSQMLTGD